MKYLDMYSVYPDGRVLREDGKEMKHYTNQYGYKFASLKCEDGKFRSFYIHRMVGEEWLTNPSNLPIIMHIDDDPSNNHWTNLQWGTQKDNIRDMMGKGRRGKPMVVKHYKLLSPEGKVYEVTNMKEFCKGRNLHPSSMTGMYRGYQGRTQHKGWTRYTDT